MKPCVRCGCPVGPRGWHDPSDCIQALSAELVKVVRELGELRARLGRLDRRAVGELTGRRK